MAAATISVKIGDILKKELEYENIEHHYLNNASSRFRTYVVNRFQLINGHTTPSQWNYVETESYTANEGSRGVLPKDVAEKSE